MIPYWRLSSFYFFNCAVLGALLPYWGLYLQNLDFSASQIGTVTAILIGSNIVAPNVWGFLSDYTGRRMVIIRYGTLVACLSFCAVFYNNTFVGLAVIIGCCSFCWQGLNSQFEVITLGYLRDQAQCYGQIRLWGSVGFVFAVSTLGVLFDYISIHNLPFFVIIFLIFMCLSTFTVSERGCVTEQESSQGLWQILSRSAVWGLLLAIAMVQFSNGAYYGFYSLYLDRHGYSPIAIGTLWSVGIGAEIAMFLMMKGLILRLKLRTILLFSLMITSLRWLGIAYWADIFVVLVLMQLLHAFTFSATHTVVIQLIKGHFGIHHQGQGQALYSSLCIGGGTALGAVLTGQLWEWSSAGTFFCSALVAIVAFFIAWFWVYPVVEDKANTHIS